MDKPDCYKCKHRRDLPGNAHSHCSNENANVTEDKYGIKMRWFIFPISYDPVRLVSCDGFEQK